jgi:hypothetical protein
MSKMDDLRAMREARYEQSRARAKTAPAAPARPATTAMVSRPEQAAVVPDPPEAAPSLCGHRNMGGRTCTREAGHAAKSHRYS